MISKQPDSSEVKQNKLKLEWGNPNMIVKELTAKLALVFQTSSQSSGSTLTQETSRIIVTITKELPQIMAEADELRTVFEFFLNYGITLHSKKAPLAIEITYDEQPRFYAFFINYSGAGIETKISPDELQQSSDFKIINNIITKHYGMFKVRSISKQEHTIYFTLPKLELLV